MMDPKFYHNNNSLQRCDAFKILEEYSSRIRWSRNKGEKVLDIGCGDGGVTVDLLRPYIPENCAKLTGCDISQEMIRHANLHHKDDGIEFRVLDIADEMPLDMVEEYDHVFSFYALHWVQEQQRAMSNLHAMLAPGGDCLLTIICHAELYDSFRLLATTGKWSKYMEDIEHLVSPYQDSKDPAQEFTDLMHESGFIEVDVQCRKKQYTFENVDMYKNFLKAVNPIKHRLSEEQYAEFCEDEIQLSRTMGDLQDREPDDDSAPVQKAYTMLVAYGVKGQITPRRP